VAGFRGQLQDGLIQPTAAGLAEELMAILDGESILGEGGMDAVFDSIAELGESHPGAGEFSFIADLVRGDPNGGECAVVLQGGQTVGVNLIGLIDVSHHNLGFDGMGQSEKATGLFDFVGDPIPVTYGLQGDGGSWRELGTELTDCAASMLYPTFRDWFGQRIEDFELGVAFVSVQAYTMHSCFPPFCDEV
jgi:hypothetical protein